MTDDDARRWTRRGAVRAAGIAAVALGTGAALGYVVAHEPTPHDAGPRAAPRPDEAERALLSPLHEGSTIEGFDLAEIHPIGDDGVLRIVCRRARAAVRFEIALAAPDGPAPARVAGPYALRFTLENATPADGDRLTSALAAILRANAATPPPPRLAPFAPRR